MADINIDVGLKITPDSIRNIQSEVSSAFRNISPQIDINEAAIRRQVEKSLFDISAGAITFQDIKITDDAITSLSRRLSQGVRIKFNRLEAAQQAVETFRKQLESQARITVQAELTASQLTSQAASGEGGDIGSALVKVANQKAAAEITKLTEAEIRLQLATRELAELRVRETSATTAAFTQNVRALTRISDVSENLSQGIITAEQALSQLRNIDFNDLNALGQNAGITLQAQRKRVQTIIDTTKAEKEASDAAAEAQKDLARSFEQLNREFKTNQKSLNVATAKAAADKKRGEEQATVAEARALQKQFNQRQSSLNKSVRDATNARNEATNANTRALKEQVSSLERQTGITTASAAAAVAERALRQKQNDLLRQQNAIEQGKLQGTAARVSTGGGGGATGGGGDGGRPPTGGGGRGPGSDPFPKGFEGKLARVQRQFKNLSSAQERAKATSKALSKDLAVGASRAEEFGRQVLLSARRFLAWSVPSQLIFGTISKLREAITTVIELDTQARRLVFFQGARGGIANVSADLAELGFTADGLNLGVAADDADRLNNSLTITGSIASRVTSNFDVIIATATSTGVSLDQVAEALVTVSRVGRGFTSGFRDASSSTNEANGAFVQAALNLVRLEGGAIGAEEAVRALVAIEAQFVSRTGEAVEKLREFGLEQEFVANTANKLAVASANTTANVQELTEASRRVGSAFRNVQDLSFDQVLGVISKGFEVTGQSASRLSTALRQVSTLAVQNSDDLKALTGIEIVDPGTGAVKSFSAILDVLGEINKAAGTFRAEQIARTIGDRRNLDIILSLSTATKELREQFDALGTTEGRLANAGIAAIKSQEGIGAISQGLEANVNRLNTAFTALIESQGTRGIFNTLVQSATSIVTVFDSIIKGAAQFKELIVTIGLVSLGGLVQASFLFAKGIFSSVAGSTKLITERQKILSLLEQESSRLSAIIQLEKTGVLTAEQAATLQLSLSKISESRARNEARLLQIKAQELQLDKSSVTFAADLNKLEQQRVVTQEQLLRLRIEENQILNKTNAAAATGPSSNKTSLTSFSGKGGALALGALAASATIGPELEKNIKDPVAKGATAGITTGMALGFLAGPLGILAGGIAGAITGGIIAGVRDSGKETKAAAEKRETQARQAQALKLARLAQELKAEGDLADKTQKLRLRALGLKDLQALSSRSKDEREKQLIFEEALRRVRGGSTKITQQQLNIIKAQVTELGKIRQEEEGRARRAREEAARTQERVTILVKVRSLTRELNAAQSDVNGTLRIRNKLAKLFDKLETLGFEKSKEKEKLERRRAAIQERSARAARAEVAIQNRAKVAAEALINTFQFTEKQQLDLRFKVDTEALDREFKFIEKKIADIQRTPLTDPKQQAAQLKEIQKLQDRQEEISVQRLQSALNRQKRALDISNTALQDTAKKFESSITRAASALSNIVKEQEALAGLFDEVGQRSAAAAERSGQRIASFLEDVGADLQTRLLATRETAQRQLSAIRVSGARQLSTLGKGFDGVDQLKGATNRLVGLIAESGKRGLDEVFNKQTGIADLQLQNLRNFTTQERGVFSLRIRNAQREVQIRQKVLGQELQIIQTRIENEKALQKLRLEQFREFGNLIIQGPEQFNKAARDIGASGRFFEGVTNINIDSLRTLIGRARNARGQGQFQVLQAIERGLKSRQQFGLESPVQGIGAEQLRDIFLQAQFRSAEDILKDLQKQQRELDGQTDLQKQARDKRAEIERLQEFSVDIQQALLKIAQAEATVALSQREQLRQELVKASKDNQKELRNLIAVGQLTLKGLVALASTQARTIAGSRTDPVAEQARARAKAFDEAVKKQITGFGKLREEQRKQAAAIAATAKGAGRAAIDLSGLGAKARGAAGTFGAGAGLTAGRPSAGPAGTPLGGVVGASVLDSSKVFQEIGSSLRPLKSGRLQLVSPELTKLREITERTGGTRGQRSRLRELERQSRRTIGGSADSQGRIAARRFLKDEQTAARIEQGFRTLLQDRGAGVETQFVRQLRDLRGEGRRGAQRVDTTALRRLLGGQGLGGLAEGATTSKRGAAIIDRLLKLSDELSDNQKRLSRDAGKEIKKILSEEVADGIRDLKNVVVEAQRGIRDAGKRDEAGQAALATALKNFSIAAPEEVAKLNTEVKKAFSEVNTEIRKSLIEAGKIIGGNITASIEQGSIRINIPDDQKIGLDLSVNLANSISSAEFARQLAGQLEAAGFGDKELIDKMVKQLQVITAPLIRKGLISASPDFVGSGGGAAGSPGTGG
ncbi:MAG: hypothetical protein ACXABY_02170 [Candidatus Thorarchaeota archaeon]|jgi:hypothetical protein